MFNYIIIFITGVLLLVATISAFNSKNNIDFGVTRIISGFTLLFFIFACLTYYFTQKLSSFFFVLFFPLFMFLIFFGNDIPVFIRIIFVMLYFRWGFAIFT